MSIRQIQRHEYKPCLELLAQAFLNNPSVNSVVKNDRKRPQRIRELARYSIKTSFARKGAFISSGRNGIALCYPIQAKKEGIIDFWNQAVLLVKAIGISRFRQVLQREAYIKSRRPQGNYLYFWFFGVTPGQHGSGDAVELKNHIFRWADNEQLPICLETSVEKNKRVYERYGFQVYHTWTSGQHDYTLYFMQRPPTPPTLQYP